MQNPIDDETLQALLEAHNYRVLDKLLNAGRPVTDRQIESIAQAMAEVEFGRFTLTPGWWSLVKKLLPMSQTLREHIFAILSGSQTPIVEDPYRKTDRSNLLHAIAQLDLSANELAMLRRLREQISPPVYREDVDAVLFEHMTEEERFEALQQIWIQAADRAVQGTGPRPAEDRTGQGTRPRSAEAVADTSTTISTQEARWWRSPFRLLACMPFRVPEVSSAWADKLQPALGSLGDVLRVDWTTGDWVRDIRRIADGAAFVLVDLTSENANVRRELRHMLHEEIPCICYAHQAQSSGVSTVGQIHPSLATHRNSIDPEIWGIRVYTANYRNTAEVERLISTLERELRPFQDMDDPTAPYVGRDISTLPEVERRGFELARIPRSRVSAEKYWKDGRELIPTSAIFRARVFSWLSNPNLHIHCAKNLWLREHLLLIVRADIERGHRLSLSESAILHAFLEAESSEAIVDLVEDILADARHASNRSRAETAGLPPPSLLPELRHRESPLVSLRLELTEHGEPTGLRASSWPGSFRESASELRRAMTGPLGPLTRGRLFALEADSAGATFFGEIEDELDYLAEPLSTLTLDMVRASWAHKEIETFLQTTVSLAILDELRQRRLFEAGTGEAKHERLAQDLGYIWERAPAELRLFEFSSRSRRTHFRGIFPWTDVREQAMRVLASEVAPILREELSDDEILERSMEWDYIPAQLWDITIRTRMADVATADAMRGLWAQFVLPSAFLYWRRENIYTNPADTDLWVYV